MKLTRVFFALFCLAWLTGATWLPLFQSGGGGGGYVGPGDVVASAIGWWGLRCYANAYSGNVVDITDAATGSTTGTRLQCSGGVVSAVVSASACTFVTGNACSPLATTCATACNVPTLYDQSGAGNNVVQATNSVRPKLLTGASCPSSVARCLFFTSTASQLMRSANTYTTAQPGTLICVGERSASFTTARALCGPDGGWSISFLATVNTVNLAAGGGTFSETAADSALHALQGLLNGGSSTFVIDGTAFSGGTGGNALSGNMFIGETNFNSDYLDGYFLEGGFWASNFTSTQYGNMNSNIHDATNGWNF